MIVLLLNTDMRRRSPNWDFVCYVYQLEILVEMIRRVSEPSDKNASVLLLLFERKGRWNHRHSLVCIKSCEFRSSVYDSKLVMRDCG